jgi:hypothetical protein
MSDHTLTVKGLGDKKTAAPSNGILLGLASIVCGSAIISWLAGVGLHRGFGISVPFVAGLVLLLTFMFFLRLSFLVIGGAWFTAEIQATPQLTVQAAIAEEAAQQVIAAQGFLAVDQKLQEGVK